MQMTRGLSSVTKFIFSHRYIISVFPLNYRKKMPHPEIPEDWLVLMPLHSTEDGHYLKTYCAETR